MLKFLPQYLLRQLNHTVIVGGFNLELLNWNDNLFPDYPSYYSLFNKTLIKNSFVQLFKFSTRSLYLGHS